MKKEGYYSTGEFMKQANITKKTIRYYDEKDILKPSFVSDSGARYYTEKDLAKLQQILLLKYLGFSLGDIKEMQVDDADKHFIVNSLNIQQKLVEDRIEQLQLVASTIREATDDLQADREVDWTKLFELIQVADLESILKKQYKDASNIMARINLHKQYSVNKQGWFPWIYEQMQVKPEQKILEKSDGVLLIRELPDTVKQKETEAEAYSALWDLMIALEKELPMSYIFYGQDSLVKNNSRYDEIGIFLPNSLFLTNLEHHVEKAEEIIYAKEQ